MPDRADLDRVFAATYGELKRLAVTLKRGDSSPTLTPTVLVNEAWLKLAGSPALGALPPLEFKRVAARAMRQVLVEAARRRHAGKRGGPNPAVVTFDEALGDGRPTETDVIEIHEAIEALAAVSPRQAGMVEARFFGGFEVPEIAQLLEISEATVLRDWRAARAWLGHHIRQARSR